MLSLNSTVLSFLIFALLGQPCLAQEVYKWTDEQGKVHYGDALPAKKKINARELEFKNLHPTEEQRKQSAESLARSRALLSSKTAAASSAEASASSSASASATVKPTGKLSCKQAQKMYDESIACFARYTDAHHVVDPKAYQFCSQAPQPEACRN